MTYTLKLKNEVTIDFEAMKNIFLNHRVFVFGYGSLLYPPGWRGRNMAKITGQDDLIECCVRGYRRGPFGIYSPGDKSVVPGLHFYGVVEASRLRKINGVINEIPTLKDWVGLMKTECVFGLGNMFYGDYNADIECRSYNYRVVDITDNITDIELPPNAVVHMVANEATNEQLWKRHRPAKNYYTDVLKGVTKFRSPKFRSAFLKSGGISYVQQLKFRTTA